MPKLTQPLTLPLTRRVATALSAPLGTGGGSAPVPGTAPTVFAIAPTESYHPNSQAATLDGSNRVLSCLGLQGLAALSGVAFGGATVGPVQLTDARGRKFWRFEGTAYLLISNALNALSSRGYMVAAMIRHHRMASLTVFQPRYASYTDDSTNTHNTVTALRSVVTASAAALIYGATIPTNSAKHVSSSEPQVVALSSRPTAGGGQRVYKNNDSIDLGQNTILQTGMLGGVICGVPAAGNAVTSSNQFMDLYEWAIWKGELTNSQSDANVSAMVSNWAIPPVVNRLMLEGDSITQGTGNVSSGINLAMLLSDPGSVIALPAGWSVYNQGTSGNTVSNLVTRRDAANGGAALPLPGGRNIYLSQIGRNDIPSKTGAQVYAEDVALHNTASTGVLQRGWEVVHAINICVASALNIANSDLRTLLRAAQFKTDTLSGPGQTYDGKLSIIDLPAWTVGGDTIFDTTADAGDTTWMAGDNTHPNVAGAVEMAKAYRAALAALGVA